MALTKIKEVSLEEIRTIKNNPPEPIELNWDPKPVINLLDSEQFHEHYQELVSTREEQKQHLKEINTHSCALELKSIFNPDSNSDSDDDKNNSSSSTQYSNKNNSDSNSEQYITLSDLNKKQELK
ncbi:hypothetical protein G9A89_018892 [Geosiphon pyriformis]|nr:hypothetical protein G9A89_018892 [Geosiphon pyriformis]